MLTLQQYNLRLGFIFCLLTTVFSLSAQETKYGHTNLGNLLELMPETKKAEEALKAYADSLSAIGNQKEEAFRKAYSEVQTKYQNGELTPLAVQQAQDSLGRQQREIQAFDQKAQELGAQRRNELLNPILEKLLKAIGDVAKENGYIMIFDTSSGAMLFADEADDVTPLVRKKLGL